MKKFLIALMFIAATASAQQDVIFDVDSLPIYALDSAGNVLPSEVIGYARYYMFTDEQRADSVLEQEFDIRVLGDLVSITRFRHVMNPDSGFNFETAMWMAPPDTIFVTDTVYTNPFDVNGDGKINMKDIKEWFSQ